MYRPAAVSESKEHLLEAAVEFAELWAEIKEFYRKRTRITSQGHADLANETQVYGRALADMLSNAIRGWHKEGRFSLYFQVDSGAVHTMVWCRTLSPYTRVTLLAELTGEPLERVDRLGYRVCGHCRRRSPEAYVQKVNEHTAHWVNYLTT